MIRLGSGNSDESSAGERLNCAAVFNNPCTSLGFYP
jgi:hypothetical protein